MSELCPSLMVIKKSQSNEDNFLITPFSPDEVAKAITKLNSGKTSGFDDVSADCRCIYGHYSYYFM